MTRAFDSGKAGALNRRSWPDGTISGILYAKGAPPEQRCGLAQVPDVVAGQIDVLPAKRRQVRKTIRGHRRTLAFQRRDSLLQIDCIP
jgi:hypothetical protein